MGARPETRGRRVRVRSGPPGERESCHELRRHLSPKELARLVARQCVREHEAGRNLVRGQPFAAELEQLGLARRRSRRGTTTTPGTSPISSSVTPTTAASATSGWRARTCSISTGLTRWPPIFRISLERPGWKRKPSGVAVGEVAGPEPAVAEDRRRLLGLVEIAGRHVLRRAPRGGPISPAGSSRPPSSTTRSSTPGIGDPDRAALLLAALRRQVGQPRGGLGLAVHHEELRRLEGLAHPGDGLRAPSPRPPA